ncbi:FtsX-like permease family protein [Tessaracoccus rhinocerotis]|uniref:FtsX-like permease family protein n=1 Tax=Tessaracoccus rhinocerotis TaxID=1689449 RepID=A0A553K1U8_9ACTN|nr:FtsX-like permease family protein [Tessaracoccus rhinocerotis]TRY18674.1 FtsX-like permease family protein [Tessaracoccus rhinocerotis]
MLRDAINEIRLHPGRFVATLLAIAISVGFIAAISTVVNTESEAIGRSNALPLSRADVVVIGQYDDAAGTIAAIEGVDGVRAAATGMTNIAMLSAGDSSVLTNLLEVPREEFRWAELAEGRWPTGATEVALSTDGLGKLGVAVGDTVNLGSTDGPEITVVGSTHDAKSLFSTTAYADVTALMGDGGANIFVVRTVDGADTAAVIDAIDEALPAALGGETPQVLTGAEARQQAVNSMTADVDIFKYLLYAFAAVALLVGMIIISNTFTILLTQRRRQIGLLRAVGASTGQVRGRLVWEALLLGIIGSVIGVAVGLGVAAIAGTVTGSMFWGLVIRPTELAVAAAVGVAATMVSVIGPALASTRVRPLEALQTVPTAAEAKRAGAVRIVLCSLLAAAGIGLVVMSRVETTWSLVWGMGAGFLISIAVLAAAPLYVAPILRGLGRVFGFAGPTVRLAAENAARNPKRAAATTVALMLAVGLVVTLQVGVASVRTSGTALINERFPVDITAAAKVELSEDFIDSVRNTDGAQTVVTVQSKPAEIDWPVRVRSTNPARSELGVPQDKAVADDEIRMYVGATDESEVTLEGVDGPITLKVRKVEGVPAEGPEVSQATFERLTGDAITSEIWVKLTDRTSATALNEVTKAIEAGGYDMLTEGGAVFAGILEQVLDVVLLVLTALLGVAVLIALVGVSNTLGLSVIERQRESALLRALGMQRASLRLMLLTEALLLAVLGTVVGIIAGVFFGWLGVSSAFLMMGDSVDIDLHLGIDVPLTLLLIAVCVAAAALASVLPGRRAANATPTEALAAE